MGRLIELATYNDKDYGMVTQFFTESRDVVFFKRENINGKPEFRELGKEINEKLLNKYFGFERNI